MANNTSENKRIAVIGLGSMGYGMAQSCLRAGHRVWGIDVDAERVAAFRQEGGAEGAMRDVAATLDVVAVVVVNAAQTEAVLFGENGVADTLRDGAVIMGCATVPPEFARDMARRCDEAGLHYLDAPISGGAQKAAEGRLSIMLSGAASAKTAAQPALKAMAENVFDLGDEPGAGSAMKAVNQLLAGVHIAAMAEAVSFGMTQGISPQDIARVIPNCAGTSWMLENRLPHIVEGDYTPRSMVDIWPKDLGIVGEIAQSAGIDVPLARTAFDRFAEASARGWGQEDDAAVIKLYAQEAGLDLPEETL